MNVVFMGTPDFAVPCLKALIDNNFDVKAVFTQPDKPKGRGMQMCYPPVKQLALENNIEVFQPTSLKDDEVENQIKNLNPNVIIVVAYGKILPQQILEIPPKGCINIHASLLPKYRGAGPIQWSILNGEKVTGITSMYMEQGLDTGDMILKQETEIGENETASELHDRLSILGADVLIKTLELVKKDEVLAKKQDDNQSTYAPMLTKELCNINFSSDVKIVHNQIRGLSTWPCATLKFLGKTLKVYKSNISHLKGKAGELLDDKKLIIGCKNGGIELVEVQYEGGKRMSGEDFLRGKNNVKKGEIVIGE